MSAVLRRLAANPFQQTLALTDSLALDSTQLQRLSVLREAFDGRVNTLAATVQERMQRIGNNADPQAAMQQLQGPLADAQRLRAEALTALQGVLTPAQWDNLPPRIKNPQQGFPGGGPPASGQRPAGRVP